jgi:hypothetical protein
MGTPLSRVLPRPEEERFIVVTPVPSRAYPGQSSQVTEMR